MEEIFRVAALQKRNRGRHTDFPLRGQTWGMIFSKPSTRTRVSFEVGVRELGGETIFLNPNDIQLGRGELIKDTARVLARMVHGAIIRTFAQADIEEFAEFSGLPTINALTDDEHPCQILADIFTVQEKRGSDRREDRDVCGRRRIEHRALLDVCRGKIEFRAAAGGAERNISQIAESLKRAGGNVVCNANLQEAASGADVLYTDIWVSMGKEGEEARRQAELGPYWVNQDLVKLAKPGCAGDALPPRASRPGNRRRDPGSERARRSSTNRKIGSTCRRRCCWR